MQKAHERHHANVAHRCEGGLKELPHDAQSLVEILREATALEGREQVCHQPQSWQSGRHCHKEQGAKQVLLKIT